MIFILLAGAILWDGLLAEPPSKIHPTVWMGGYIKILWQLRKRKTPFTDFILGSFILISGVMLSSVPLYYFLSLTERGPLMIQIILGIPLLKVSFSIRYLLGAAEEIRMALAEKDLDEARGLTAYHLVSRDTSSLNREEIVSAVIESVAENITDSFISPLFYFLFFGIPGAWAFRFINTGDAMIAYRTAEYEWGGKMIAWADSLLNWIPARLAGIGIVLAACINPGSSGKKSWATMIRCRNRTASPNAGWTMSAMAGALNAKLEKKGEYLLNGGDEELSLGKIDNCLRITLLSLVITMLFLLIMIRGGIWVLNTVA